MFQIFTISSDYFPKLLDTNISLSIEITNFINAIVSIAPIGSDIPDNALYNNAFDFNHFFTL